MYSQFRHFLNLCASSAFCSAVGGATPGFRDHCNRAGPSWQQNANLPISHFGFVGRLNHLITPSGSNLGRPLGKKSISGAGKEGKTYVALPTSVSSDRRAVFCELCNGVLLSAPAEASAEASAQAENEVNPSGQRLPAGRSMGLIFVIPLFNGSNPWTGGVLRSVKSLSKLRAR